jgi:hypothetical protein
MNGDTAITQLRIKFTLNLLQSVDVWTVMWVSSPYREKIVTFGSLNPFGNGLLRRKTVEIVYIYLYLK